jgi:hypothetical protein
MSEFLHLLQSTKPALIVSLTSNSVEQARAAEAAGADAIKVHINVTHHATGVTFGTLAQERPALEAILGAVKIPVGLVPGEDVRITRADYREIAAMGFTVVDAFAHVTPGNYECLPGMDLWVAADCQYSLDEVAALTRLPWVDAIEAAVIPTAEYGQLLSQRDLATYLLLAETLEKPFVVPSQRRLRVEDVPALLAVGAKNLMIGAVVTGKEVKGIEEATRAFRRALDQEYQAH